MSGQRYTPEFKDEAVKLITERGYSVTDVAERLGVSQHSIYKWLKAVQPLRNSPDEHCQRHSKIDPFYLTNGKVKLTPLISY